ncbi:MAG: nucleotidyl transferase AbiEii/AbiGii toxin family protein [Myxococcales bacterium]|nr:nucleotidyl transferase AbiEii/AbiGii toxin family protein [Myxococcales bacterium]
MSPDAAASVRTRLLRRAKASGESFELFLVRYACERFLYRLGASPLADRCLLKGASLLAVWMQDPYRATRDVDLLASGASDEAAIRETIETICRVPCVEDGITFDLDRLAISPIRPEEKYSGQRAVFTAHLGKARIRMQVDFGFGDAVASRPEASELPTLVEGLPAPSLRVYPREVSIAEKFEAMVTLGRRNSRMKDFHDVWALSQAFAFEGPRIRRAVADCFERRETPWTPELPDVLGTAFYEDDAVQARWAGYRRAGDFREPPPEALGTVGERIRSFLGPVREAILAGGPLDGVWPAGGPWRAEPQARGEGRDD